MTEIVGVFVHNADFYGLYAFVARRRVKIQAVAASMQIGAANTALVRDLDLPCDLYLSGAIVAAGYLMETGLDPASRPFGAGRRLGALLPLAIVIPRLTVFSAHSTPLQNSSSNGLLRKGCASLTRIWQALILPLLQLARGRIVKKRTVTHFPEGLPGAGL